MAFVERPEHDPIFHIRRNTEQEAPPNAGTVDGNLE